MSYISHPEKFEFGMGSLKIVTSHREGTEDWKAFLFTNRKDALIFAQLWAQLPADKEGKVHLNQLIEARLNSLLRIGVVSTKDSRTLYTSEVHYRVTNK